MLNRPIDALLQTHAYERFPASRCFLVSRRLRMLSGRHPCRPSSSPVVLVAGHLRRRSSSPAVLAGSPLQAVLVVAGGPGRPSSSPVVLALAGRPGRPSSSPVAASNGATPLVINGGSKIVYRSSKNKTRWKQKVRHRFQAKTQHTTRWKQKKMKTPLTAKTQHGGSKMRCRFQQNKDRW